MALQYFLIYYFWGQKYPIYISIKFSCINLGEWDDVGCSTTRQYVCEKPDSDQLPLGTNAACSCESGWTANLDLESCYKRVFDSNGKDWGSARSDCQVH